MRVRERRDRLNPSADMTSVTLSVFEIVRQAVMGT